MARRLPTPPPRIARLPRNKAGYPVPWFVAFINGRPGFRIIGEGKLDDAIRFRCCWLCGDPLGANAAFVLGPMCGITRTSPEPPSHRDCADYAARACPFLATPNMRRRETGIPEDAREPDGIMICRNPGATLVWVSRTWQQRGLKLWYVGDPVETRWYAEGREATRDEVLASIESGLPLLRAEAERDPRPAAAHAELAAQHARALRLVPGGGQ